MVIQRFVVILSKGRKKKKFVYAMNFSNKQISFFLIYLFVDWTTLNRNEGKNNVSRNNMSLENWTDLREFNRAAKSWSVKNPHVTSNRVLFRWTISFYNTVRIFVVSEFRPRTFVLSPARLFGSNGVDGFVGVW